MKNTFNLKYKAFGEEKNYSEGRTIRICEPYLEFDPNFALGCTTKSRTFSKPLRLTVLTNFEKIVPLINT